MADILNIGEEPIFDDCIRIENHTIRTYNPYVNTTFRHSDKIRIPIQQDLYSLPWKLSQHRKKIDIKRRKCKSTANLASLEIINCVSFMFDEIRFELNGTEIDHNRNIGITSLMKSYALYSGNFAYCLDILYENAGFSHPMFDQTVKRLITCDEYFNFYVGYVVRLLRRLQTCRLMRVTNWFWYERATTTIALWEIQRQRTETWIVQYTVANASRYVEWSQ